MAVATDGVEDVFVLDVQVITEAAGAVAVPCSTDDGCGSTCSSACNSNV